MYVPPELTHRIENISKRLGSDLDIVRCWKSDFREGTLYCDFRGIVHRSQDILIEVAGTLCAELSQDRNDEVDIFLFVNGKRVGLMEKPFQYLIGFGDSKLAWDYNDEGFDQFDRLDDKTFSNPIDESLVIHPPNNNPDEG